MVLREGTVVRTVCGYESWFDEIAEHEWRQVWRDRVALPEEQQVTTYAGYLKLACGMTVSVLAVEGRWCYAETEDHQSRGWVWSQALGNVVSHTPLSLTSSPSHTPPSFGYPDSKWPIPESTTSDSDAISKNLARILRHAGNGIDMDAEGWADVEQVRNCFRSHHKSKLEQVFVTSIDKHGRQRFECQTLPCGRKVVRAAVKETFVPSKELEQLSRFLAALLRGPDVAIRNGVNIQDPDGWVATQQVRRAMRHPELLERVVQSSCHKDGEPRFEMRSVGAVEQIRAVRLRRSMSVGSTVNYDVQQHDADECTAGTVRQWGQGSPAISRTKAPLPRTAAPRLIDFTRDAITLERLCLVNKEWSKLVMPSLTCPGSFCGGSGRREMRLPCLHKICKVCFFEPSRKCPRCDMLYSHEDYMSLNAGTDPRSSAYAGSRTGSDTGSILLGESAVSPRERWFCRQGPDPGEAPFHTLALAAAEAAFAKGVLETRLAAATCATRYWRLTRSDGGFHAKVYFVLKETILSDKDLKCTPEAVMEAFSDVRYTSVGEFKTEQEAVFSVVQQV
eukprot:TRINITY_DN92190_c0_g1_i1.p1 TRINITY_DN92190_c0_g1~~TRINITY_DN92190_c0_g1_i1.p1  ORF type:complete len:562 (-),score=75.11 TRINITY_DN92190_c0_g1_i1:113-1798(-)